MAVVSVVFALWEQADGVMGALTRKEEELTASPDHVAVRNCGREGGKVGRGGSIRGKGRDGVYQ